jgi:hypothetical protein
MRVNVYAEEMTDRIEIISKEIDGHKFTGLRIYLELPCTIPLPGAPGRDGKPLMHNVKGPFIHRPGDDDSSAVTFWGKQDLRVVLRKALEELDAHYARAALIFTPLFPNVPCCTAVSRWGSRCERPESHLTTPDVLHYRGDPGTTMGPRAWHEWK